MTGLNVDKRRLKLFWTDRYFQHMDRTSQCDSKHPPACFANKTFLESSTRQGAQNLCTRLSRSSRFDDTSLGLSLRFQRLNTKPSFSTVTSASPSLYVSSWGYDTRFKPLNNKRKDSILLLGPGSHVYCSLTGVPY